MRGDEDLDVGRHFREIQRQIERVCTHRHPTITRHAPGEGKRGWCMKCQDCGGDWDYNERQLPEKYHDLARAQGYGEALEEELKPAQ